MSRRDGLPPLVQFLLWGACNTAAGSATGLALGAFRPGGFDATLVWISVLFGNVVGFTVLLTSVVLFPRIKGLKPAARFGLLGLALVSGSIAGTGVVLYAYPLYVLRDFRQAVAVATINGILALVLGATVHVYESLRSRLAETLREVEEVRLVEAKLKEAAARAELAALQARINPHFFFNTLNTISSLLEEDPGAAEDVVQTLADLFRYTFRVADSGPVPLGEELAFIEGYLDVEKARFGDRLKVVWSVDPRARSVPVPGLILQPLVENAIGHGIAPRVAGGTVRISARIVGSRLEVVVEDDGEGLGLPPSELIREGHGLANVVQRLGVYTRGAGSLGLAPGPSGRGAVARLELPVPEAEGGIPEPASAGAIEE